MTAVPCTETASLQRLRHRETTGRRQRMDLWRLEARAHQSWPENYQKLGINKEGSYRLEGMWPC